MSPRFDRYFEWLIPHEGEFYENDPDDRGGGTKFGIDSASHPGIDIENLTREQAKAIYHAEYWTRVCADDLPHGVGEIVCDIAVNNGRDRAIRKLQYYTGSRVDGHIGPQTISNAQKMNKNLLIDDLLNWRDGFYRSIAKGSQMKFLKGWLRRNEDLRRFVNA